VVSLQRDRMVVGLELAGDLSQPTQRNVWSLPTAPGEIQLDGSGRVHVLVADRQTIAGYPRIATVISPDIDEIANAAVGAQIELRWVDRDEALQALQHHRDEREHRDGCVTVDPKGRVAEVLYRSTLIGGVHDVSEGGELAQGPAHP
jgi:5-oxoprolinase (ATP-hydrolysing) subunit C